MLEDIKQFPGESRVWIYQADRFFSTTEQEWILEKAGDFMNRWANHGKPLTGTATILNNCQLVLVVNEAMVGASGCSIDSSVRFVKELGNELNANFFDRFKVLTKNEGKLEFIHFNERTEYVGRTYYDTLIQNLSQLQSGFEKQLV